MAVASPPHHVDVRQQLDALGHAGDRREDEADRQHHDDHDEQGGADVLHEAAGGEPAADLQGAEAERGGGAEERREDRQDVDGAAERALGTPAAEQRDERRADQLRAPAAERAVRDGQADHGVDRPRVQRPVEQRGRHRHVERLGSTRRDGARWRRGEVRQRLPDAVEHQADAHTRAEHHRDPRDGTELRRFVVTAQRDPAVLADREPQRENDEPARRQDERPATSGDDPAQHRGGDSAQRPRAQHAPRDERDHEAGGHSEHHPVQREVLCIALFVERRRLERWNNPYVVMVGRLLSGELSAAR